MKVPIRIGVNGGSLEKDLLKKYGTATPEAMVESAMRHIQILEDLDFTEGSTSFHALKQNPWPHLHETVQAGQHRFYVDKRGLRLSKKSYCDLTSHAGIDLCPGWTKVSEPVRFIIPGNAEDVCRNPWYHPEMDP